MMLFTCVKRLESCTVGHYRHRSTTNERTSAALRYVTAAAAAAAVAWLQFTATIPKNTGHDV